ncbi:unnamed protein product [Urochloa decumbens]|uniref:Uncharacterized protein n=1 Tax=Urochloa decumbens TaxID=240449 RepID=A0ABC8WBZ2_9POAL
MSCKKLSRRYLHLVSSAGRGMYALSRMDASRLFYPSKEEARTAQATARASNGSKTPGGLGSTGRLPEPSIHYEPFSSAISYHNRSRDVFALFGKSSILCSDSVGYTSIYNTETFSFQGMPRMNSPKGPKRITVCIPRTEAHARSDFEISPNVDSSEDFCTVEGQSGLFPNVCPSNHMNSLYVMDMDPYNHCNFEALVYYPIRHWRWRRLPSPGFFGSPSYLARDNAPFAVVDGSKICISDDDATYYFDTVAIEWRKAGDWVLPFRGKAQYVSELGMWLGFSAQRPYNLCSMDLSGVTAGSCDTQQPMAQDVGKDQDVDFDLPGGYSLKNATLVNMGLGRFCRDI